MKKINIAVFASGNGSNAVNIIRYFNDNKLITVKGIVSNVSNAGVVDRVASYGLSTQVFNNDSFLVGEEVLDYLVTNEINCIVLAGFLRKIPSLLVENYPNKIINIDTKLIINFSNETKFKNALSICTW